MNSERGGPNGSSEMILPLIAEELEISKRVKETKVRIRKEVSHTPAFVDEMLHSERYDVTRVPVNRRVEGPVAPRQEGDTLILPVLEEVVVVEKRLMLVEEIHITRKVEDTREQRQVDLRRENITVERSDGREQA